MIKIVKGKKTKKENAIIEITRKNNIESLKVIDISNETLNKIINDIFNKKGGK